MRTIVMLVAVLAVPAVAAPKRITCETTDGAIKGRKVTIEFDQLEGGTFNAKACGFELGEPKSIAMVNVIHQDDSGPEELLNEEEDAAQKWVSALAKDKLAPRDTQTLKLAGDARAVVYRLTGEFHGDKDAEVLVARVKSGKHNIVFMAQYPFPVSKRLRGMALQVFTSATVKIAPE